MSGQIPAYGEHFRLERAERYSAEYSHSLYVCKRDSRWFIRSDKTSKRWQIFYRHTPVEGGITIVIPFGTVAPSLSAAMENLVTALSALNGE